MAKLVWDAVGSRTYETGVDHGVLYTPDAQGAYTSGVVWNGLVSVTESPSGAEATKQYADNMPYIVMVSAEEFGGTIEAFSSPVEFDQHDGTVSPKVGVSIGQQSRKPFGMVYRTRIGNDLDANAGYKLHLVYGAQAAPAERANTTINDSPEATTLSWEFTTSPVAVADNSPTAHVIINSTLVDEAALAALETVLFGDTATEPELPLPDDVLAMFTV